MNLLELIKLLNMNYSGSLDEYGFFMELIDRCIGEDKQNPFSGIDKDTVERGIRGQNGLSKAKLKKVNQFREVGRLAKYIEEKYPEDKIYLMESQIKLQVPDFNPDEADFSYPCENLFFQLLDVYINTTNKRSKKKQESTALSPDDITLMTESPVQQPVVQQFVQNQFNISQTGNGINIGHADTIEIRDGKVVTLK